jgi:hypothetical protein
MFGESEVTSTERLQHVAMTHRHAHATLGIKRQCGGSLEVKVSHKFPRTDTFSHFSGLFARGSSWALARNSNEIKHLANVSRVLKTGENSIELRTCDWNWK